MILDRHPDGPGTGLRAIGYWRSEQELPCEILRQLNDPALEQLLRAQAEVERSLPDPRDFTDPSWDADERATVIAYLRAGKVAYEWKGLSWCRFGCKNNRAMGARCLSDDVYIWPEGFAHYLERHAVRPPEEFVRHALTEARRRRIG